MQRFSPRFPGTDFAIQPQFVKAVLGQMVQLDCVYFIAQPVLWEKEGNRVVDDNKGHFTIFYNGTLRFNSVTEKDNGIYTCIVSVDFWKSTARCHGEVTLIGGFTRTNYSVKITP